MLAHAPFLEKPHCRAPTLTHSRLSRTHSKSRTPAIQPLGRGSRVDRWWVRQLQKKKKKEKGSVDHVRRQRPAFSWLRSPSVPGQCLEDCFTASTPSRGGVSRPARDIHHRRPGGCLPRRACCTFPNVRVETVQQGLKDRPCVEKDSTTTTRREIIS